MANVFSKQEKVMFDEIIAGCEDALEVSEQVAKYGTEGELMERSNDTIWREVPMNLVSADRVIGSAVSTKDVKQLMVPSNLGYKKVVPWKLSATELRDSTISGKIQKAASEEIATRINLAIRDVVSLQGTLVVDRTGASGDYDDFAAVETIMDEMGIPKGDRHLMVSTRDWQGAAGNLASRTLMPRSNDAYSSSQIGNVANLMLSKMTNGYALGANAATVTIATNGSQVRYVPLSSESTVAGTINVDNRTQQVTVSTTSGVTAGDAFTIAGINNVHARTKESTGQPKTFRVISVDDGTTMTISPPMIGANSSPTNPELMYKNIDVASTSASANITFLNGTATTLNPFWYKDSIELLLGRYNVPENEGAAVLHSTTKQGVDLVLTKQFTANKFESEYFLDAFFGVVNLAPEMNGVQFFGQS